MNPNTSSLMVNFCLKTYKGQLLRLATMKYLIFLVIIVFLCLTNCNKRNDCTRCLDVINLENAFDNAKEIFLSDFVEDIEYVILEPEKPIDKNLTVYSNDAYLICIAVEQIYLFDRKTGAFIREIGRVGRGPGEYKNGQYFDNETKRIIVTTYGMNFGEYDLNGKMTRTITQPKRKYGTAIEESGVDAFINSNWILSQSRFLDDNTIVYCNSNLAGNAQERLLIANEYGTVLTIFNNPYSFVRKPKTVNVINPILYRHGKNILYFENCIDTIYKVTKDSLIPHFRLEMGRYKAPYEKRGDWSALSQFFMFTRMEESDRFLFFDFSYTLKPTETASGSFFGYYDKKRKIVKISDAESKKRKHIVNDIDQFGAIQFARWTINDEQNEMISYIEAIDVVEWFEHNKRQAKEVPEHLQKLSTLQYNDNPLIVIAKLK